MVAVIVHKSWGIGYHAATPQHANKKRAQHGSMDTSTAVTMTSYFRIPRESFILELKEQVFIFKGAHHRVTDSYFTEENCQRKSPPYVRR
jgi:hypothetical protein